MNKVVTKHTPGPWDRTNLTVHTKSTAERGALGIARVFEAGIETAAADSVFQATANARLIAAAPEMRDTIRKLAELIRRDETAVDAIATEARALLARIDGTNG